MTRSLSNLIMLVALSATAVGQWSMGTDVDLLQLVVTPASASVNVGSTATFTATATFLDGSTQDVTLSSIWSSSNLAVATIGASADPQPVTGQANGNSNIVATYAGTPSSPAVLTVGTPPLTITSRNCPVAAVSTAYTCMLSATGGSPPYVWSVTAGALPTWATLSGATITGTPPAAGTANFTVQVADSAVPPNVQSVALSIDAIAAGTVNDENYYDNVDGTCNSNMAASDGPAALPTQCLYTAMDGSPVGSTFYCVVPSGQTPPASCTGSAGNYATITAAFAAISSGAIACGSTVKIVATSDGTPSGTQNVYHEPGTLTFPATSCDPSHWIIVETDMVASLPLEGTNRVSPAFFGVSSLPGRPNYSQPVTPGVYMPQISPAVYQRDTMDLTSGLTPTSPKTQYVRFIGIEFVQPGPGSTVCAGKNCTTSWQTTVVDTSCFTTDQICPDHIIFDRIVLGADNHSGKATYTICTGMRNTGTSIAVINSYLYQITGLPGNCEPKAIGAGNTPALAQGPYKYFNNYFEGGGENYFWGGGYTSSNARNVQIRRCHMFSPWTLWMPYRSQYLGTPVLKKNMGESKAGSKMLIESNVYEYVWYGQDKNGTFTSDQYGVSVLLHTAEGNLSNPFQDVTADVTFRYNLVRHGTRATNLDIAGCSSSRGAGCGVIPPGKTTPVLQRMSVHDNVFDDISPKWFTRPYGGQGGFDGNGVAFTNSQLNVGATNTTLNNIMVDHNTIINSSYNQDLTVASILTTSAGVATLTATGQVPFLGTGMAPVLTAGMKIQIFGACAGFDQYAAIASVISTTPQVSITYNGAPPSSSCYRGFVSLLHPASGSAGSVNEFAGDRIIVSLWQQGSLASALVSGWDSALNACAGVNTPSGCPSSMTFTVWGLTGAYSCYNNNQPNCGILGTTTTASTWSVIGRGYCTGVGVGSNVSGTAAQADVTKCRASGQYIFVWQHIQSGLGTVNPANSWFSYRPTFGTYNYGPSPNLAWVGITITNNIMGGQGLALRSGALPPGCATANTTATMITLCGIVRTSGPGAINYSCNVVASHPFIAQANNPTDQLPPNNSDTVDHTFQSVGFTNFNYDGLGLGVPDLSDLSLAATSQFKGGLPGCDGSDPGAHINLLQQRVVGVR